MRMPRLSLEELTARLLELEGHVGDLEKALQRFVPQPNPTVIEHNPGPRATEKTTLAPIGHPDWIGTRHNPVPEGEK